MDERMLHFRTTINTMAATPNNPATAPNTMPIMADECRPEVAPMVDECKPEAAPEGTKIKVDSINVQTCYQKPHDRHGSNAIPYNFTTLGISPKFERKPNLYYNGSLRVYCRTVVRQWLFLIAHLWTIIG